MSSAVSPVTAHPPGRRSHQRYPLSLKVDYPLRHRSRVDRLGSARTINISTGGVLLDPVMWGHVLRGDSRGVAIELKQRKFRIAGLRGSNRKRLELKVRSITV